MNKQEKAEIVKLQGLMNDTLQLLDVMEFDWDGESEDFFPCHMPRNSLRLIKDQIDEIGRRIQTLSK